LARHARNGEIAERRIDVSHLPAGPKAIAQAF
jgi:hypothetical protein